jgi:predicted O-methyltransferase YrrM
MTYKEYVDSLGPREKPLVEIYQSLLMDGDEIPKSKRVLEIGSGWGIFSRAVLEKNAKLTTIDKLSNREEFIARTDGFKFERIIGASKDVLPKLSVKYYDFIFVDGSHLYEDVINDLRLSWDMLLVGGLLLIDDVLHPHNFDDDYGVSRALWDFMNEKLAVGSEIRLIRCGSGGLAVIRKS